MKHRSYQLREATLADIPELKEMYKATLRAINIADYTSEVCITAKPFFERKGYTVVNEQKRKQISYA